MSWRFRGREVPRYVISARRLPWVVESGDAFNMGLNFLSRQVSSLTHVAGAGLLSLFTPLCRFALSRAACRADGMLADASHSRQEG